MCYDELLEATNENLVKYRASLCMILKSKAFKISVVFSNIVNQGETPDTLFGRWVRVI